MLAFFKLEKFEIIKSEIRLIREIRGFLNNRGIE